MQVCSDISNKCFRETYAADAAARSDLLFEKMTMVALSKAHEDLEVRENWFE